MTVVCGIYGYPITRAIDLPGMRIEPRTIDHERAKQLARDLDSYQLTGVLRGASISDDRLFNLEAILSFIEHLDVLITSPVKQIKCVETFRQRKPFVEVSYFLLYSGLESFARAVMKDRRTGNPSRPICKLLTAYGFDVRIERPDDLPRAVSTYTHLRNALFHNSDFKTTVKAGGQSIQLNVFDYLFNLSHLVSLVVLKAVEFDDGHINWNSWIDRQPFK